MDTTSRRNSKIVNKLIDQKCKLFNVQTGISPRSEDSSVHIGHFMVLRLTRPLDAH